MRLYRLKNRDETRLILGPYLAGDMLPGFEVKDGLVGSKVTFDPVVLENSGKVDYTGKGYMGHIPLQMRALSNFLKLFEIITASSQ